MFVHLPEPNCAYLNDSTHLLCLRSLLLRLFCSTISVNSSFFSLYVLQLDTLAADESPAVDMIHARAHSDDVPSLMGELANSMTI